MIQINLCFRKKKKKRSSVEDALVVAGGSAGTDWEREMAGPLPGSRRRDGEEGMYLRKA